MAVAFDNFCLPSAPPESRTDLEEGPYALLIIKPEQSGMHMQNDKRQKFNRNIVLV